MAVPTIIFGFINVQTYLFSFRVPVRRTGDRSGVNGER